MKILHTSDWHLGRTLYGRKRYAEFEAFLSWLSECIDEKEVDILLIAGDIFDNTTPSHQAQALYYQFLCRISQSDCQHVVVIAGNHDSPSFIEAPKELLSFMNIHVVGKVSDSPEDEVCVLRKENGDAELIVCAVPYLRDRDIRTVTAGETVEDKDKKLVEGIRRHYEEVAAIAEQARAALGEQIPIIGMGHLFTAGGKTVESDGVRDLYVGSLAHLSAAIFPTCFDYLALGHLHIPQKVAGSDTIRYSGSPMPMGFNEAETEKSVSLIEIEPGNLRVSPIPVPPFQRLEQIRGDWEQISRRIGELTAAGSRAWLEIIYDGSAPSEELRSQLDSLLEHSKLEVLRVKNNRLIRKVLQQRTESESLDDLRVHQVFTRCLETHQVPAEEQDELLLLFNETLNSLQEEDPQAE